MEKKGNEAERPRALLVCRFSRRRPARAGVPAGGKPRAGGRARGCFRRARLSRCPVQVAGGGGICGGEVERLRPLGAAVAGYVALREACLGRAGGVGGGAPPLGSRTWGVGVWARFDRGWSRIPRLRTVGRLTAL